MSSPLPYRRRTGIGLNMIVRDETPVLARLFASVAPFIDHYVIVDTGSSDGTPEFIERWMAEAGIAGEVHRRPWVNFGVNRSEALDLAVACGRADWLLLIDADEELGCADPSFVERLVPGVTYQLEKHHDAIRYRLPNLIDVRRNRWRWRGAVHEYLEHLSGPDRREPLREAWVVYHSGEGARSRGRSAAEKFLEDARLLEAELQQQPDDARSRFYLAQSYRDAGEHALALEHYQRRAAMTGGWDEERYWAAVEVGRMRRALGRPYAEVAQALVDAHALRPQRAEALHELARICREDKLWQAGYLCAKEGARLERPPDQLFVMPDVYAWRLLDELAVAAYWAGHHAESRAAASELLRRHAHGEARVPEVDIARVRENLRFAEARLAQAPAGAGTRPRKGRR